MPELSKIREMKKLASEVGVTFVGAEDTRGNHVKATFEFAGRTFLLVVANTASDSRRAYLNNRAQLRRYLRGVQ